MSDVLQQRVSRHTAEDDKGNIDKIDVGREITTGNFDRRDGRGMEQLFGHGEPFLSQQRGHQQPGEGKHAVESIPVQFHQHLELLLYLTNLSPKNGTRVSG